MEALVLLYLMRGGAQLRGVLPNIAAKGKNEINKSLMLQR
jgi:hypothetical protein